MRDGLQSEGWAVFAPSGAVSWRSFETSRDASIRAFMQSPHWEELWPAMEARGYECVPLAFTRREVAA